MDTTPNDIPNDVMNRARVAEPPVSPCKWKSLVPITRVLRARGFTWNACWDWLCKEMPERMAEGNKNSFQVALGRHEKSEKRRSEAAQA